MQKALRGNRLSLGIYAALLAGAHGVLELLQGRQPILQPMFNAIGAPCQPQTSWHACFPALSLLPNTFWSGTVALVLALGMLLCLWQRERQGSIWLFLGLCLLLLPAGGGFVPVFVGIAASVNALLAQRGAPWWVARASQNWVRLLGRSWQGWWLLYFVSIPLQYLLGSLANDLMLRWGGAAMGGSLVLLVLITLSGAAHRAGEPA